MKRTHRSQCQQFRIARAGAYQCHRTVLDRVAEIAHLANEAVGMDIVEGEELLGALQSPVGRPEALRVTGAEPALPGQRSQLERAALVEADDRTVLWALFVEVEDGVFF